MRILLLGAGGFIGRHILTDLLDRGHDVTACVRHSGNLPDSFPAARFLQLNLSTVTRAEDWQPHLRGIDYIINAAGILRGPDMDAIHVGMPSALYGAAAGAGVKHVVLISAISARPDVHTDYSLSKLAGEEELRSSPLPWTILRPSLVYGDGSYGGTSLLRGLAGIPFITPLAGDGRYEFTPIHCADLARAVSDICGNSRFFGVTLEPVGPDMMNLQDLLERVRIWLGFGRPRFIRVPITALRLFGWLGDIAGSGPVATNSLKQLIAGNAGDSLSFSRAIGFEPRSFEQALANRPAQVQDRWHARLFFLAPAIKVVLVLLWVASAWLGLFHGGQATEDLVTALQLPPQYGDILRIGGSMLDLAMAVLIFLDKKAYWSTLLQLCAVVGYSVVIGFALPQLWFDPLGPLLKNIPILMLILVHGAIGDSR